MWLHISHLDPPKITSRVKFDAQCQNVTSNFKFWGKLSNLSLSNFGSPMRPQHQELVPTPTSRRPMTSYRSPQRCGPLAVALAVQIRTVGYVWLCSDFWKKNLSDRKCRSYASCRCGQQGTCTFCKQNKMSIFYRHWCTVKKMKWFLSLSKEGGGRKV